MTPCSNTGTTTTVLITTSRLEEISAGLISLSLIDAESGEEITSVPLVVCSGFLTGDMVVPNSTFQFQLRGDDMHGNMFEYTSNRLVTPTLPDERIITPLNCPPPQPTPTPTSHGAASGLTPLVTMCYFVALVSVIIM